jgi:hypothetical protein
MTVNTSGIPTPMKGVCYQPAPLDYVGNQGQGQKYFDTDFFNTDFIGIWSNENGGRGDLANMADLGINFLHIYDWNPKPARDHGSFLQECSQRGIFVAVPFNNSFCMNLDSWGANAVYLTMKEIYDLGGGATPYSQVAMWTIANEYNQGGGPTVSQIAQTAQIILYCESLLGNSVVLPISSPTSFAPAMNPGIAPTQDLQAAFAQTTSFLATINGQTVTIPALPSNFFDTRYVAATNPQNPGAIPPAASGITIASWLPTFVVAFPHTPVWFSEIGIGIQNSCNGYPASCVSSEEQQASFLECQLENADPSKYAYLLGSCIFEYTPDYQNPPGSNNYSFSLLSDSGGATPKLFTIPMTAPAGGGQTYPVQCLLTSKPVYRAVKKLWNGSGEIPNQYCPS